MRQLLSIFIIVLCALPLSAQRVVPLPDKGGNGITGDERVGTYGQIFDITSPRMDVYLPKTDKTVPMILVCPGGAYEYVSVGNEGKYVAEWAMQQGIAVAVLKYRMPNGHENIPLSDALAAMRILRDSAQAWNLIPDKIGVMGFSAGGHLAGSLLTMYTDSKTRPDFGVLVYPVLSMISDTHQKTRRLLLGENHDEMQKARWTLRNNVTKDTPPCFIVACQDDKVVPVSNSLDFYTALTRNNVPAEMLLLPTGGHGFGFQREIPQTGVFRHALLDWLHAL